MDVGRRQPIQVAPACARGLTPEGGHLVSLGTAAVSECRSDGDPDGAGARDDRGLAQTARAQRFGDVNLREPRA